MGGVGGGLTIAAGTETLTGTNTYTGATTIDLGATLALGDGVSNGTVAGNIVDNGLVQFDYNGAATIPGAFSGGGSAEAVAGTVVITGAQRDRRQRSPSIPARPCNGATADRRSWSARATRSSTTARW